MAEKKIQRTVAHPRSYFMVEGKMQRVAKGGVLNLTKKQAESKRVQSLTSDPKEQKTLVVGGSTQEQADANALQKTKQHAADLLAKAEESKKPEDIKAANDAAELVKKAEAGDKKR